MESESGVKVDKMFPLAIRQIGWFPVDAQRALFTGVFEDGVGSGDAGDSF